MSSSSSGLSPVNTYGPKWGLRPNPSKPKLPTKRPAEQVVKDIRRATRRHFSAEDNIRIVLDGLPGEDSIAELCRKEGIAQSLCYTSTVLDDFWRYIIAWKLCTTMRAEATSAHFHTAPVGSEHSAGRFSHSFQQHCAGPALLLLNSAALARFPHARHALLHRSLRTWRSRSHR